MSGDPEDVDGAGTDLDDEEAVQTPQRHRAVHVEDVHGQHRRRLRTQELPPRRVGLPPGRRWQPEGLQDPADRGGAHPVAEREDLALDPLVAPRRVLGREPLDQRDDLRADRWPAHPPWMGPCPCDQTGEVPLSWTVLGVTIRRSSRPDATTSKRPCLVVVVANLDVEQQPAGRSRLSGRPLRRSRLAFVQVAGKIGVQVPSPHLHELM